MSTSSPQSNNVIWLFFPRSIWVSLVAISPVLAFIYYDGIVRMIDNWNNHEEYSHGWFIPVLSALLIWQQKDKISRIAVNKPVLGVYLALFGVLIYFVGELSAITIVVMYSFIIVLAGIALALAGVDVFKKIWIAFIFLLFMLPIPRVIYQQISQQLQLISSEIGVFIIRLFDISVHLEGNVIDLGSYKLQVVEACSGLRYLFPLMSLSFIAVYFYREKMWKRTIVFLSSIPITILLNSFRIGVIGVLVEFWGQSMAEGFLHDFEGWVIFMVCMCILIGEMWVLHKMSSNGLAFSSVFGIDYPDLPAKNTQFIGRKWNKSYITVLFLIAITALLAANITDRNESIPEHKSLALFPLKIQEWEGVPERLESDVINQLGFSSYILAAYKKDTTKAVSFYSAYYESQRRGESIHSPRACLPGSGWQISSLEQILLPKVDISGDALKVNRVVIQKGEIKQLVYYWFKQRHRNETSEYSIKWYLFWDALTINRTDGALIRITALVQPNEDITESDQLLSDFIFDMYPVLSEHVPD